MTDRYDTDTETSHSAATSDRTGTSDPATSDPEAEAAAAASDAALARYRHRHRRQRLVYFSALGAIVAVLLVIVGVAWSHGEIAHTSLHTVANPLPTVAVQSPSSSQQLAWRSSDTVALGDPQWNGTVVAYDAHSVHGLDARTGRQTWSYTRSDRTVCTAAQISGTTVAVYEVGGNCDEVTGLRSDTGAREWTRTLDEDGQPLNGHPSYQVLSYTFMLTTPSVIYALQPDNGYDRWVYSRFGCSIEHAVLGTSGALISQNCTRPQCDTQKYCSRGRQLLLRDGINGRDDDSDTNPDKIKWDLVGNDDVPVSADTVISALNPTARALDTFQSEAGKPAGTVTLKPAPQSPTSFATVSAGGPELVWIGGVTYALQPDAATPTWSVPTPGPPSVVGASDSVVSLPEARISVLTDTGVALRTGRNGAIVNSFPVTPLPSGGSSVLALGAGFLVTSGDGIAAYR